MVIILILGICFIIGGFIGILVGYRIRRNAMINYQLDHLYPIVGTDGEIRFTPFGILFNSNQEKEG